MSNCSILPIIVLYNTQLETTIVYRKLLSKQKRFVIYDNSIRNDCSIDSSVAVYYHDSGNGGVSAAYNYGALKAKEFGDVEAMVFLDQDTEFQSDYLSILEDLLVKFPDVDVFVPQVYYNQNLLFSPVRRGFSCKKVCLEEGLYSFKNYLPVNSGACVRLSAFEKTGGYNPKIRLDFADFDFFSRLGQISSQFYLINSYALQSFSNDETDLIKLERRYRLFVEGAKYAKRNPGIRSKVIYDTIKHTIALTIRTHSLKFLKLLPKFI